MKKTKPYLIIVVLVLIFDSSCGRERGPKEEQHYGPLYLNQFANYFWFKPGTYWIYENNRTGELDTSILSYIKRDTITFFYEHSQFKRWYTYENLDFLIDTKHRINWLKYGTTTGCLTCQNLDTTRGISREGQPVFYIPWNYYSNYSKYFSTIQLGTTTYYEVYKFDLLEDVSIPTWDNSKLLWGRTNGTAQLSSYYWAKDIGLVQIDYKTTLKTGLDSASWILKSYDIKKF